MCAARRAGIPGSKTGMQGALPAKTRAVRICTECRCGKPRRRQLPESEEAGVACVYLHLLSSGGTKSCAPLADAALSVSIRLASHSVPKTCACAPLRVCWLPEGRRCLRPAHSAAVPTHTLPPRRCAARAGTSPRAPRPPPPRPTWPLTNDVFLNRWEDVVFDTAWWEAHAETEADHVI
ncbi:hypothetical protein DFH11DRAFT_1086617 [Phellopilus nigrolimitatus]|nr:hypothetical protein DFH11DRAFT_1086617 [Phellopilus nigrolimitatus]